MFDCLTIQEQNMIMNYIECYAGEGGYEKGVRASLPYILRFWEQNKQPLFDMFNQQFIISKPVSYNKAEDELIKEMNTVMYYEGKTFRSEFSTKIKYNPDLDKNDCVNLCALLAIDTIVNNIYNGNSFSIVNNEGKKLTISKGMKTMKALRKVADFFNLEGFEDFRLAHSLVLNQKKLEGTLHLSIHPLDFMTMSDNDSDWDSCMSWKNGGSYRRGTVEMMNSPMVVVGYFTTDSTMRMPGGETWNDKKWRELFIVDRNIITNVLGYPYRNEDLTKECLNWLRELSPYANELTSSLLKYNTHEETWCEELNKNVSIRTWTEIMYNDFRNDHFAFLNKNEELWIKKEFSCFDYVSQGISKITADDSANVKYIFNYSSPATCMCCGSEYNDFPSDGTLCCYDCEPIERCECCDEYSTEELIEIDGQLVCPYCYEEYVVSDALTGEPHLSENCEEFYVALNNEEVFYEPYYTHYTNFDLPYSNVRQTGYFRKKVVMIENLPEEFFDAIGYRTKESFINTNKHFTEDWSDAEWDD